MRRMQSPLHRRPARAALAALVLVLGGCSRQEHSVPAPVAAAQSPPTRSAPAVVPAATAGPQAAAPVVQSPRSFELLEIGALTAGGRFVALMKVDGGPATAYAVGDSLGPGARLRRITNHRVEVERDGGTLTVELVGAAAGRTATPVPRQAMPHGAQASELSADPQVAGGFGQDRPRTSSIDRAISRAGLHEAR